MDSGHDMHVLINVHDKIRIEKGNRQIDNNENTNCQIYAKYLCKNLKNHFLQDEKNKFLNLYTFESM